MPVNVENDTAASIAADATATHDGAVIVHLQGGVAEGQKQTIGHLSGPGGSYNLTASAAGLRHSEMVNLNAGTLIWNIIVREDHIEFSFSPL